MLRIPAFREKEDTDRFDPIKRSPLQSAFDGPLSKRMGLVPGQMQDLSRFGQCRHLFHDKQCECLEQQGPAGARFTPWDLDCFCYMGRAFTALDTAMKKCLEAYRVQMSPNPFIPVVLNSLLKYSLAFGIRYSYLVVPYVLNIPTACSKSKPFPSNQNSG